MPLRFTIARSLFTAATNCSITLEAELPGGWFLVGSNVVKPDTQSKSSIFEIVYRRQVQRMGHNQAIGVIAHRLCQLIWILLHRKVHYEERGPAVTESSKRKRTARMVGELRLLGYHVEPPTLQQGNSA